MWIFRAVKASPVSFKTYLPTTIINPFVFITLLQSLLPRILLFSRKKTWQWIKVLANTFAVLEVSLDVETCSNGFGWKQGMMHTQGFWGDIPPPPTTRKYGLSHVPSTVLSPKWFCDLIQFWPFCPNLHKNQFTSLNKSITLKDQK